MEEFIILANRVLTGQEQNLYTNQNGAIIKTILLHNTSGAKTEVALKFDNITFKFPLEIDETRVLDNTVLTKTMTGQGNGINIHVTALQL